MLNKILSFTATVFFIGMLVMIFAMARYTYLFNQYVEWEKEIMVSDQWTNQWIPSSEYLTTARIFFIEDWELSKGENY